MKKNTRKAKERLYVPNTKLYIKLTSIFGVLTIILFIILFCSLENNSVISIVSSLISIMGGLLASVIVAWIIDFSKCTRDNKEIVDREEKIMKQIDIWIDDLFQSFADSCFDCEECNNCNTWEYWLDLLVKYNYHRNKTDFYKRMLSTYVSLNCIISDIDLLNNGHMKEYQTLNGGGLISELLLLSDACKKLQRVIFESKEENIEHIKFLINDITHTILRYSCFNDKQYCVQKQAKKEA